MEWIIMNDELMHEGKPGMHWGINKYQTKSGKWTPLGLKRRREREGFGGKKKKPSADAQKRAANKNEIKNVKSKAELESAKTDYKVSKYENKKRIIDAKNGTIASKLANKVKEDREARAAAKKEKTAEEIIRSGDMKTVLANKNKLSNAELSQAIERMRLEQNLSAVSAQKKQAGADAYKRFADIVSTTANLTSQGINTYNNIAKIMNTVRGTDLKIIGDKKDGPSAYDRAMNAARLKTAQAAARTAEMNARAAERREAEATGGSNSSSSSSTSSTSGNSSSSASTSASSASNTPSSTSVQNAQQTVQAHTNTTPSSVSASSMNNAQTLAQTVIANSNTTHHQHPQA